MNLPLNDLIALEIIEEKEDDFATPDKAKSVLKGKIVSIGSPSFLTNSGYQYDKAMLGIKEGDTVAFRRIVEERQQNPAVRTRLHGKEVLLISCLELLFKLDETALAGAAPATA